MTQTILSNGVGELVKKARFLRNAAPQQFDDFYGAFAEYAERQYEAMVDATTNLTQAQGHAQQCKKILMVLAGARNG